MNLKTTNLDFYDDKGAFLRKAVDNPEDIPEFVKSAHVMTGKEDADMYALVLHDSDSIQKKFSTYDQGNTWLSAAYFSENYSKLPSEAQKVAAHHIKVACEHFDIPVIDIISELAEDRDYNIVDLEKDTFAPVKIKVASEEVYALTDSSGNGIYPINSASAVAAADKYFSQYYAKFTPRQRREYSVKVASQADKYGMKVGEEIGCYSGDSVGSSVEDQLVYRAYIIKEVGDAVEEDVSETLDLLEKVASIADTLEPDILADTLERFDKKNGLDRYWGRAILDPYRSVLEKKASGFEPQEEVISVGPLTVSHSALHTLAKNKKILVEHFGLKFAEAFQKEPISIFSSMPDPQKRLLINMANDSVGY